MTAAVFDPIWAALPPFVAYGEALGANLVFHLHGLALPQARCISSVVFEVREPVFINLGTIDVAQGLAWSRPFVAGEVAGQWVAPSLALCVDLPRLKMNSAMAAPLLPSHAIGSCNRGSGVSCLPGDPGRSRRGMRPPMCVCQPMRRLGLSRLMRIVPECSRL